MTEGHDESTTGRIAGVDARIARMRADDRQRRAALAVAIVLGFAVVALHWVGLFVAGALVGLTRQTLSRALAAGLAFGVLVVTVFFIITPPIALGNVLVLAPLSYVTVGIALVGPVWGALARGIV